MDNTESETMSTPPPPVIPRQTSRAPANKSLMSEIIEIPETVTVSARERSKAKGTEVPSSSKAPTNEDIQSRVAGLSLKIQEAAMKKKVTTPIGQVISEKIKEKYKRLSHLGTGKKQSLIWRDEILRSNETIDLDIWFDYTSADRRSILKTALGSLTTQCSVQSVASIMVCAWGLRSCENIETYMFYDTSPKMSMKSVSIEGLESRVLCRVESNAKISPESIGLEEETSILDQWERAATYMCAATLRLVVKEETNLINAWEYMMGQYRNFYQEDILIDLVPNAQCLRTVRQIFQSRTIVKNTTGRFLLAFEELVGQDKGVCQMLFALQMCYTGMHAYSLLLSCADKLGAPLAEFVALLEHPSTANALEAIAHILTQYEFPQTDADMKFLEGAKTWRYARIFEQDMFAHVQTKNCIMLTSVLALISHKLGTKGAGDVTKIRQIAGFAESQREWLEDIAQAAVDYCLRAGWASEEMTSGIYRVTKE